MDRIVIDENGYVFIGGAKVCRIQGTRLEFLDRSRLRAEARDSQYVYVDTRFFCELLMRISAKDETNGKEEKSSN